MLRLRPCSLLCAQIPLLCANPLLCTKSPALCAPAIMPPARLHALPPARMHPPLPEPRSALITPLREPICTHHLPSSLNQSPVPQSCNPRLQRNLATRSCTCSGCPILLGTLSRSSTR
ncbi:hypothetical protein SLEP1_g53151 [Rubroshorea leprosula]|uniref:Secreted protein n=1 Tax=Rubroshorea leprosula TaxID=152421 RepID=A0AAV5M8I9_9ROSI|nr:hypothetical protein SLEP1_g53151 [Rubroshorea leprosula]